MNEAAREARVLIVGAGPVGLAASILLAGHGVESLVVERNPSTTDHPKAHVVNTRTMEIFRSLGIDGAVREAALPDEALRHVRWVRSIAGPELGRLDAELEHDDASPVHVASCAQDRVESILLGAAAKRGVDIRFDTEVVALEPEIDGVSALVRTSDMRRGDGERLRARYVIAADGASSGIRHQLGIAMQGLPEIATMVGTYFHADLRSSFAKRPAVLYWIVNSAAPGTIIALDGAFRWVFHLPQPPGVDELGEAEATRLVRTAIGDPRVPIEIRGIRPWRMSAQIAESYRHGRVFLAGDAAHRFPPTGGLGLNTGVQDAHNLAWKLAWVLDGRAPERLLETYESERKPVAEANSAFSLNNALRGGSAVGPGARIAMAKLEAGGPDVPALLAQLQADIEANREHFGSRAMDLGFRYVTGAIVPADGADGDGAKVGERAPHAWLVPPDGARVSTLDLFGADFVLLTTGNAERWSAAGLDARVSLRVVAFGPGRELDDPTGEVARRYGLASGGAVLVRPDGHVAWRTTRTPREPRAAVAAVIERVLAGGAAGVET